MSDIVSLPQNTTVRIEIEAKFGFDATEFTLKKYKFLYHLTPSRSVPNILKYGLVPKTRNKKSVHPDRIYLTTTNQAAKELLPEFIKHEKIHEWTVLKINIKNVDVTQFRVFVDPAYPHNGLFTLSNISPQYISIEEQIG